MRSHDHDTTRRSWRTWATGLGSPAWPWARCCTATGFARADGAEPAAWTPPDGKPHFTPRAKNVIWLFMIGGTSHLESFDPKPALNRYAGKTIAETPFAERPQEQAQRTTCGSWCRTTPTATFARRSIRFRSAIASGASRGSRSATGGRTWARASTTWPSSARCGRPTTTTGHSCSSTPAGTCSKGSFRRSARGSTTAWARSTTTCRSSWCWARRSPTAAAAWAGMVRATSGPEHDGVQLSVDPKNPLPFASPGARRLPRRAGGRVRAAGPAEPALGRQVSRRPCAAGTDQVVRAGLPHADGRARGGQSGR